MGVYSKRVRLRNDFMFDQIIEEVARDAAQNIRAEATTVPRHDERLALAERVLRGRDTVVSQFFTELKDRAVRAPGFLNPAYTNAVPNAEGELLPIAADIPDDTLTAGLASVWNEAMTAATQEPTP